MSGNSVKILSSASTPLSWVLPLLFRECFHSAKTTWEKGTIFLDFLFVLYVFARVSCKNMHVTTSTKNKNLCSNHFLEQILFSYTYRKSHFYGIYMPICRTSTYTCIIYNFCTYKEVLAHRSCEQGPRSRICVTGMMTWQKGVVKGETWWWKGSPHIWKRPKI
jgi:hypothetical protein